MSLPFYILPQLQSFDGIIGYDFLKEIGAKLDIGKSLLIYSGGQEALQLVKHKQVNNIVIDSSSVPLHIEQPFNLLISKHTDAFATPDRALPYNTSIEATIRTITEDPIYTKSYPYTISATEFINKEIESLLKDGIIQRSWSSYNSPVRT